MRPVVGEVQCEATQGEALISFGFWLPWHSGLTGSHRCGGWWWEAQGEGVQVIQSQKRGVPATLHADDRGCVADSE